MSCESLSAKALYRDGRLKASSLTDVEKQALDIRENYWQFKFDKQLAQQARSVACIIPKKGLEKNILLT